MFKQTLESLETQFSYKLDKAKELTIPWIENLSSFIRGSAALSKAQIGSFREVLLPIIDMKEQSDEYVIEFNKMLKSLLAVPRLVSKKKSYTMKSLSLQELPIEMDEIQFQTTQKAIWESNSQPILFARFINYLAEACQFQTFKDKLMFAIREYIIECVPDELEEFSSWIFEIVNSREKAPSFPILHFSLPKIMNGFFTHGTRSFYRSINGDLR